MVPMGKLDKIKNLIDKRLQKMEFTQYDRDCVYARIEARRKQRRRQYTIGFSAAAFACAAAMLVLLILPAFGGVQDHVKDGASADQSVYDGNSAPDTDDTGDYGKTTVSASGIEVTAVNTLGSGLITCDSSFYIDTENSDLSAEEVGDSLQIQPEVAYTLTLENENLCLVTLDEQLPDGGIVTLSLDGEEGEQSWAFQTESALTVVSTTPADQSSGMPLDTGIEINFSRIVAQDAQGYIEISPAVSGSFQYRGKSLIFVPEEDLQKDAVYTVKVKAGLSASSGEVLAEDYVFSFRTPFDYSGGYSYFYYTDSISQTYTPEETIAFSVNATEDIRGGELSVDIYKLSSADEYLQYAQQAQSMMHQTLGSSRDVRLDLSAKNPYIHTSGRVTQLDTEYGSADCVILPELEEGWYIAQIKAPSSYGELTLQKLIQVSALSVYYQSIGGESLFWLNSARSGEAVEGATIRYIGGDGTGAAVTDENGLAGMDCTEAAESGYVCVSIESGEGSYAELFKSAAESTTGLAEAYYSYLYLDRAAYLPNDTIRFWGMLSVRQQDTVLPGTLELQISGMGGTPRHLTDINVAADGSFTGSFDIENYISGYVTLYLCCEGEPILTTSFTVCEYTKPSYVLDLSLDRAYYRSGDTITATAKASFYDGTPAAGVQISVEYYGEIQTMTADSDGLVRCTFTPTAQASNWTESYVGVSATIGGMEDVYVWAYASAKYFHGSAMLTVNQEQSGTALTLQANAIDFTALAENLDTYLSNPDQIRGEAVSLSGEVKIIKHYYEKVPTGSYYDEIEKRRVDTYDYNYQEEVIYTENFTTGNGQYTTKSYTLAPLEYGWYTACIDYTDPNGNIMQDSIRLLSETYPYGSPDYYFSYEGQDAFLKLDESVPVQLYAPDGSRVSDGRLLCTLVTDEVLSSRVENDGQYEMVFTSECLPNVRLYAAYFDGEHVYAIPACWFEYDSSEKQLFIELAPSDETVKPGGNAEVKLTIRDAQGNPVESNFVLSVVDEAAFAVMEQYNVNPLTMLYRPIYVEEPVRYASYTDVRRMNLYAEGGGEGGTDGLRENFKDTAAFITGKTDASGQAVVRFALPENLTSWRITVAAVTENAEGGVKTENIATTLDYFASLVLDDVYTAGDDVSMSARVYGVPAGEPVEYEVYLDDEYLDSYFGKSGEYTFINLGPLDAGSYSLAVRAVCGEQEDGLIRTVEVKSSRHSFLHYSSGLLSGGVKLEADRYPVTLFAYDTANSTYIRALSSFMTANFSRADRYFAYALAYEKLISGSSESSVGAPVNMSWQDSSGGVCLMRYAQPDAYTTAMALVTAESCVDSAAAVYYLYSVLDDYHADSAEVAAAYMGLAAVGEPVLSDVHVLMADFAVTDIEYYYLSCALALLGDRALAGQSYEAMFGAGLTKADAAAYVEAGDSDADYIATAHALFLGTLLGHTDSESLAVWLLDTGSDRYLANFEFMAFVSRYKLRSSESVFTCLYNGKTVSFDFADTAVNVLQFNKTDLEKANFKVKSGEVSYLAVYSAPLSYRDNTAAGSFRVSLTPDVQRAQVGKDVKFSLSLDVSENSRDDVYIVDIVLPAGVRYTGYQYDWNGGYSLISNENGRLSFAVSRTDKSMSGRGASGAFSVSFQIYTTAILPGSFVVEEAVAQAPGSGLMAIGSRQNLQIK